MAPPSSNLPEVEFSDFLCLFTPHRAAILAKSMSFGLLLPFGVGIMALQFGLFVGGSVGTAAEPFVGMDRAFGDYIGAIFMGAIMAMYLGVLLILFILPLQRTTKRDFRWIGAIFLSQGVLFVPWAIWSFCREISNIAHPNCQIYDWGGKLVKPLWVSGPAYAILGSWYLLYVLWTIGLVLALRALLSYVRLPNDNQPRCQRCHYLLYGLTGNRCPECGTSFPESLNRQVGITTGTSEMNQHIT